MTRGIRKPRLESIPEMERDFDIQPGPQSQRHVRFKMTTIEEEKVQIDIQMINKEIKQIQKLDQELDED